MTNSSEFAEKIIAGEDILSLTNEAADGIMKSKLAFPDVLSSLEPFLTSLDVVQRSNGILFLANVLELLPADFLNTDEVDVVSEFFIKKLAEHFSITPHVLKGLSIIVGMENFTDSQVLNLLGNLQCNVTVQTLTQASRLNYYEILQKLLLSKETVLKSKPNDFVYAIITGMDSEGDPRNLLFLYQFIPEAYSKFPLEHLAEEAFSVLECYFPIDFTPKGDGSITRDDLARGLENCFVSSTEFGPFVFPMILEKLESSLKVAQVDSLKLLIKGFDSWNIKDINPHTSDLWKAFKLTLLQAGDSELVDLALNALTSLLRRYSSSALSAHESATLDQVLQYVTENTHRFLSDPTLTLFLPSIKVLNGVALSSRFCCEYVVKTVVPQLLALAENKRGHDAVLSALSPILSSCIYYDLWTSKETQNILSSVPSSLISLMKDSNSQNGCFLCLKEILSTLDVKMRNNLYSAVLSFLSTNDPLPEESYSTFLVTLALTHPDEVKQAVLDCISISDNESSITKKKKLRTICWCCNVPSLTKLSSDKIMHFISTPRCSSEALDCLKDFVVKEPTSEILCNLGTQCNMIQRLHQLCLSSVDSSVDHILDKSNYVSISKIIEVLMRHLTTEDQRDTCASCLLLYTLENAGEHVPPFKSCY
uniref:MMS19 nucleotide excision repair protein n=1 Tax=Lygus hesperus TaxID=30085 RepID=A0A0A9W535_LYGHE